MLILRPNELWYENWERYNNISRAKKWSLSDQKIKIRAKICSKILFAGKMCIICAILELSENMN